VNSWLSGMLFGSGGLGWNGKRGSALP